MPGLILIHVDKGGPVSATMVLSYNVLKLVWERKKYIVYPITAWWTLAWSWQSAVLYHEGYLGKYEMQSPRVVKPLAVVVVLVLVVLVVVALVFFFQQIYNAHILTKHNTCRIIRWWLSGRCKAHLDDNQDMDKYLHPENMDALISNKLYHARKWAMGICASIYS